MNQSYWIWNKLKNAIKMKVLLPLNFKLKFKKEDLLINRNAENYTIFYISWSILK